MFISNNNNNEETKAHGAALLAVTMNENVERENMALLALKTQLALRMKRNKSSGQAGHENGNDRMIWPGWPQK